MRTPRQTPGLIVGLAPLQAGRVVTSYNASVQKPIASQHSCPSFINTMGLIFFFAD
jgi:hypothetical protein